MNTFTAVLFGSLLLIGSSALAHSEPVYFLGVQEVDLVGNTKDCFVEVEYSHDHQQAEVRTILTHSHEDEELALGPVIAIYSDTQANGQNGFYFETNHADAAVSALALFAATYDAPSGLAVSVVHGEHHDVLTCGQLQVAHSGLALKYVEEKFSHFNEIASEEHEEHDHEHHDHDDGHQH